jgi:hypothetical protein
MVDLYKDLSKQAKAVSTLIDKELPNLVKLYEPVGELFAKYQAAMEAYNAFMATWAGRLPKSDLNGRALALALTEIERSLRYCQAKSLIRKVKASSGGALTLSCSIDSAVTLKTARNAGSIPLQALFICYVSTNLYRLMKHPIFRQAQPLF